MKIQPFQYSLLLLLCAALNFGFRSSTLGDPQITILSPTIESVFKSGETVSIKVKVDCDCMMEKLMVGITEAADYEMKAPIHYHKATIHTQNDYEYSTSITLPNVTEETEFVVEVEIQNKTDDDEESQQVYFIVQP